MKFSKFNRKKDVFVDINAKTIYQDDSSWIREVENWKIHHKYCGWGRWLCLSRPHYHDIAIIKLKSVITFSPHGEPATIKPIRLPESDFSYNINDEVVLRRLGQTGVNHNFQ